MGRSFRGNWDKNFALTVTAGDRGIDAARLRENLSPIERSIERCSIA
jgi:hypothetical protein